MTGKVLNTWLFFTFIAVSAAAPYYGKLIHSGWGQGSVHGLAGDIYAVNKDTILIKGFTHDGSTPGAHFYFGTEKSYAQAKTAGDDITAKIIPYPGRNIPGRALGAYSNEDIVLKLPAGKVITDFTYISVWCQEFNVYFGGFDIPNGFIAPRPLRLRRTFRSLAHGVSSSEITIIDDKTITIKGLFYDGQGPDAYFYVGRTGGKIKGQSPPYGKIPDENGSSGKLGAYGGQSITLTLPNPLSFTKVKWLSIWCEQFSEDFGHVRIPRRLNVPPKVL